MWPGTTQAGGELWSIDDDDDDDDDDGDGDGDDDGDDEDDVKSLAIHRKRVGISKHAIVFRLAWLNLRTQLTNHVLFASSQKRLRTLSSGWFLTRPSRSPCPTKWFSCRRGVTQTCFKKSRTSFFIFWCETWLHAHKPRPL